MRASVGRVGDDEGDGLADKAHPAVRQGMANRRNDRFAVTARDRQPARKRPATEIDQILRAQDEADAGHRRGGFGIQPSDIAMGFGRTQHKTGQRTLNADIVGIPTAAGQQPAILLARRPVADAVMPFPARRP